LIDFARFEFSLNARQSDGRSLRKHLEEYEEMTGLTHPKMQDRPVLPRDAVPTWRAFQSLSHRRSYGMGGPMPITWLDLDAYQRVTGESLRPWQIGAIEHLDGVFLEEASKK
jgi:hypothetical protein